MRDKVVGNFEIAIDDESGQSIASVDRLYAAFPGGAEQGILPSHFLRATFPLIGARIICMVTGTYRYWGLLMPAGGKPSSAWTLRSHWLNAAPQDKAEIRAEIIAWLGERGFTNVRWYEYAEKIMEPFEGRVLMRTRDGLSFGEPDREQARQAQELQRVVWNVSDPAFLYPYDLYHPDSGLASRLVVTGTDIVVGFLMGFYAAGQQWFGSSRGFAAGQWQESQLMGTHDDYRRRGIARKLKLVQRANALSEGLELIHWTVDPLQAANARLNFNSLGGVAVQHFSDYYHFRNILNRVRGSRIGISWLIASPRVERHVREANQLLDYRTLASDSGTEIVRPVTFSSGKQELFKSDEWAPAGNTIVLEIPANWNALQREDVQIADAWRLASDAILAKVLGIQPIGTYIITGVVDDPGEGRWYLVIERHTAHLGI